MAGSLAGWVFDKQADHPPGVGSGGQGGGECRGFGLCELSKAPSVTHSPGLPCPRPQPLFLPTAPLLAPGPQVEPISREPRASALPSHSGMVLTKRKGGPSPGRHPDAPRAQLLRVGGALAPPPPARVCLQQPAGHVSTARLVVWWVSARMFPHFRMDAVRGMAWVSIENRKSVQLQ